MPTTPTPTLVEEIPGNSSSMVDAPSEAPSAGKTVEVVTEPAVKRERLQPPTTSSAEDPALAVPTQTQPTQPTQPTDTGLKQWPVKVIDYSMDPGVVYSVLFKDADSNIDYEITKIKSHPLFQQHLAYLHATYGEDLRDDFEFGNADSSDPIADIELFVKWLQTADASKEARGWHWFCLNKHTPQKIAHNSDLAHYIYIDIFWQVVVAAESNCKKSLTNSFDAAANAKELWWDYVASYYQA